MECKFRGYSSQEHTIVPSDYVNSNPTFTAQKLWDLGKLFLCLSAIMFNVEKTIVHILYG